MLLEFFFHYFKHKFYLCKCVRFHSSTRYCIPQASMGFFFEKRNLNFSYWTICWEIVKFYQIFREVLFQIHFGSWAGPDPERFFLIRVLLNVSDPAPDPDPQHWLPTTCPCGTMDNYYPLHCRTRGTPRMWWVPRSLLWLALRCLSTPGQKIQLSPLRPVFLRPYK